MATMTQEVTASASSSVQNEFILSGPRIPYKPEQILPAWSVPNETEAKKQNAPNIIFMRKNMPERIYRGGKKTDLFLLTQSIREPRPFGVPASVLHGDNGEDWVAMTSAASRTSSASLIKNNAGYGSISTGNLFYWLDDIEHLIGHASTADSFYGNEKNNIFIGHMSDDPAIQAILSTTLTPEQLKALQRESSKDSTTQVAKDYMETHDGEDILIGSTGFYAGGEGTDIYIVLPLKHARQGDVFEINNMSSTKSANADEVHLPGLDLRQDVEIQLNGDHFVIIPKDPSMHQKVLFADFARIKTWGKTWHPLKIKDKTGNIYLPSADLADPMPARLHLLSSLNNSDTARIPHSSTRADLQSASTAGEKTNQSQVETDTAVASETEVLLQPLPDDSHDPVDESPFLQPQFVQYAGGNSSTDSLAEMTSSWNPEDATALVTEAVKVTSNLMKSLQSFSSWLVLPSS